MNEGQVYRESPRTYSHLTYDKKATVNLTSEIQFAKKKYNRMPIRHATIPPAAPGQRLLELRSDYMTKTMAIFYRKGGAAKYVTQFLA